MGDSGGDICAMICGGCCLVCFSGLANWCNTQAFGSRGCGGNSNAGCCGSCCNDSFDDDRFEAQVQRDLEKTRDPNAPAENTAQPQATEGMTAAQSSQPKQEGQ